MKRKASSVALFFLLLAGTNAAPQQDPESLHLVVNIPASRLDVRRAGQLIQSYPVAVGAAAYPTPIGDFAITEITWNPWWVPPPSEWAKDRKAESPGADNTMGVVKLRFRDLYFVHGTADVRTLGRAASHGCIRMSNPDAVALARVVQEAVGPAFTSAQFDSILGPGRRTRAVTLSAPVALKVVYERVEATDLLLMLHPDPYRRGTPTHAEVVAALQSGLAPDIEIDSTRLASLLALPALRTVAVPLSTITRRAIHRDGGTQDEPHS